jgi:hypothetical protein
MTSHLIDEVTGYSCSSSEIGIAESSVGRIRRTHGLKPHRIESFKVSNDPHFAEKLEAIVGLYLNPPEHALVLSDPFAIIASVKDESRRSLPVIRKKQIDITESSSVKSCRDQNPFHLHLR